jgi:hypothetical protein
MEKKYEKPVLDEMDIVGHGEVCAPTGTAASDQCASGTAASAGCTPAGSSASSGCTPSGVFPTG